MHPPVSERISLTEKDYTRWSWAIVRKRGQTTLQRFQQKRLGSELSTDTSSCTLPDNSKVVSLQVTDTAERDVVVAQENGCATIIKSEDLGIACAVQLVDSDEHIKVLAAQSLSLNAARSSLLKSRPDLASGLPNNVIILAAVYERQSARGPCYGIWALPLGSGEGNGAVAITPQFSHDLSSVLQQIGSNCSFKFTAEGTIGISHGNFSTVLNVTTTTPTKLSSRKHVLTNALSILELTKEISIYASPRQLCIGNTHLDSVLATSTLSDSGRKRKRDGEANSRFTLVAFLSQMKRVLAYDGRQLLGIDILATDAAVNPLKEGALLSNNILRGSSTKQNDHHRASAERATCIGRVRQEPTTHSWHIVANELDALAEKGDAKGFTEVFIKHFDLHGPADLTSNKIPASKLDYLLAKLFAVTKSNGSEVQLSVSSAHKDLLKWCMQAGLLDEQRLSRVLGIELSKLTPGCIAKVLIAADSSLALIESYIQISPFLSSASLLHIISFMVSRALRQSTHNMDVADAAEIEAAEEGLPSQALMPGADPDTELNTSTPATICLAHALRRLAYTGSGKVSSLLRTFDQKIVLGLIQFLRQQLFLGGYTRLDGSRHFPSPTNVDDEAAKAPNPNPQLSFRSIVTLLNGCIDAIGPVGVLGAGEDELFVQKMVPELLSEISGATDAVEDSAFLQGLVRETLRYIESMERQSFEVQNKVENKIRSESVSKGKVVTLYAEPDVAEDGSIPASALPLSLKAEEDIDRYKIRKGGQEHRRSAREIGMLKDRLRTPYSFERLVL